MDPSSHPGRRPHGPRPGGTARERRQDDYLPLLLLCVIALAIAIAYPRIRDYLAGRGDGELRHDAPVPAEYRPLIEKAGRRCAGVTPALIAAQLQTESAFDPDAVSAAGAKGIAQFIDATWEEWGEDADGDGTTSPFDPADAIDAQSRLMCRLREEHDGSIPLALAAYNCGSQCVKDWGGIPDYPETMAYVEGVLRLADAYTKPHTSSWEQ